MALESRKGVNTPNVSRGGGIPQMVKIKMLSSVAGETWSYAPGDLIDVEAAIAKVWIAEAMAIPAPGSELAAAQIKSLTETLTATTQERDGLKASETDLKGKLASAIATQQGASAEMAVHKKAAADALSDNDALRKTLAGLTKERDDFKAQADALRKELSSLTQGTESKAAEATPGASPPAAAATAAKA